MTDADWIAIKNEYINTMISQRKLAAKYGISYNTLKDRANREQWRNAQQRQHIKIESEIHQKTAAVLIKKGVNRSYSLLHLHDKLMESATKAADQLTSTVQGDKIIDTGIYDTFKMKQLTGVAKDLKDIQAIDDQHSNKDADSINALMSAIKGENNVDR